MRIVHLSDIHLSQNNFDEFHDNYREALIKDLIKFHETNKIDLVVITGDLVDKGGHSLLKMNGFDHYKSPYTIFDDVFIKPISSSLGLENKNFLFIPGNHDINENEILLVDEISMKKNINGDNIKEQLELNRLDFNYSNLRVRLFKEFEKSFHKDTINYQYSNNESVYIYQDSIGKKVGFILVNDSWRCSTCRLEDKNLNNHYFGSKQLYWAIQKLQIQDINLDRTICLFSSFD